MPRQSLKAGLLSLANVFREIETAVDGLEWGNRRRGPEAQEADDAWLEAFTGLGRVRRKLESLKRLMDESRMPRLRSGSEGSPNKVSDEPSNE